MKKFWAIFGSIVAVIVSLYILSGLFHLLNFGFSRGCSRNEITAEDNVLLNDMQSIQFDEMNVKITY